MKHTIEAKDNTKYYSLFLNPAVGAASTQSREKHQRRKFIPDSTVIGQNSGKPYSQYPAKNERVIDSVTSEILLHLQ